MILKKSKSIKIDLKKAEIVRKILISNGSLNTDLKIKKDSSYVYLPIKFTNNYIEKYTIVEEKFEKIKKKPRSYKDLLKISNALLKNLPSSYDVVGDIILIKIQDELLIYKTEIGDSLLKVNSNIKTVCLSNPVAGELRTRDIEIISGEKKTVTVHKEYGLNFYVDINKAYFSPRLANERKRIAKQVANNEIIVDMFTGICPFPIMIAKYSKPKIIYAIDKNPEALKYAKKNLSENKVIDKIELINLDAKEAIQYLLNKKIIADRIIMNLPFSSFDFFTDALKICGEKSIIHYYTISSDEDIDNEITSLKELAIREKYFFKNVEINKIKTYAPREFYIGLDITVEKKHADVA